jgi:hypothetical protein
MPNISAANQAKLALPAAQKHAAKMVDAIALGAARYGAMINSGDADPNNMDVADLTSVGVPDAQTYTDAIAAMNTLLASAEYTTLQRFMVIK